MAYKTVLELSDVTVVIPYRQDTPDRRRNVNIILDYFQNNFSWQEVLLVEQAAEPTAVGLQEKYDFVRHVAWRSDAPFHKSRLLNLGIALAETPFVLIYDADVFFPPASLLQAVDLLRTNNADFVFPFNQVMLQIRQDVIDQHDGLEADFIAGLPVCAPGERPDDPRCEWLYGDQHNPCAGGAIMCNRRKLLLHGGYNENIISYSCEDVELLTRLKRLGARLAHLEKFCCYHLEHKRGEDSRYNNFRDINLAEWHRVRNMSAERLWRYVFNDFREFEFDSAGALQFDNDEYSYGVSVCERDGRADLSSLCCVFFIDRSSEYSLEQIRAALRKLNETCVNHEIIFLEGNDDRFLSIYHTQHVVYQRLAREQISRWKDIGSTRTVRPHIVCVDLREAQFEDLHEMLTIGWQAGCHVTTYAKGIMAFDRSTSAGASIEN